RTHGRARPEGGATAQAHLPPVRESGRHRAHEHPHARGSRGDVRPRRHHPARQDRGRGDGGRSAAAAPCRRRQPGGAVPQAHGRRPGARAGGGAGPRGGRRRRVSQPSLWRVLEPKWRTALQRVREERSRGGSGKLLLLAVVFPARRTRDLLSIVALGAAGGLILLLRVIKPERLASPEGFRNLLDFIAELRTPTSPFLPSEWATKAIMTFLRGAPDPLSLILLWTTA